MPTYAYACKDCGHRFDAVQSFTDATLEVCPECSGVLRKQYGSIGVTFNGSGFYRTDSRAGGKSSAAVPATAASSKPEAKTSTTSTATAGTAAS
jgi:putative FmdB family regulatory protein